MEKVFGDKIRLWPSSWDLFCKAFPQAQMAQHFLLGWHRVALVSSCTQQNPPARPGLLWVLTHKPCDLSLAFCTPNITLVHLLQGNPCSGSATASPACLRSASLGQLQIYGKGSQKAAPGQNCLVLGSSSSLIRAIVLPLTPQSVPSSARDVTSPCW